ncbi:MAG TPA: HNH endonuclease [Candidatus Bathyarchaeia archaeon]|nr:HNH endonuclease [Candidatus Bathyarchaeia archaeon]
MLSRLFKDKKGYKRFADSGTPVHCYVAERKIGRKLKKGEVVHHKNRIKTDNRRDNLWVFSSQKKHHSAHRRDKKRYGRW